MGKVKDDSVEGLKDAMNGAKEIDIHNISEEVDHAAREEMEEDFYQIYSMKTHSLSI